MTFYNLYFSIKYDIYINVKTCTNIKAYKYIFKYVYKNNNRVNLRIQRENNVDKNNINSNLITRFKDIETRNK